MSRASRLESFQALDLSTVNCHHLKQWTISSRLPTRRSRDCEGEYEKHLNVFLKFSRCFCRSLRFSSVHIEDKETTKKETFVTADLHLHCCRVCCLLLLFTSVSSTHENLHFSSFLLLESRQLKDENEAASSPGCWCLFSWGGCGATFNCFMTKQWPEHGWSEWKPSLSFTGARSSLMTSLWALMLRFSWIYFNKIKF